MARFNPLFVTITWGAGGSTAARSLELATSCQDEHGLTTCLHLTCTNMEREILDDALAKAHASGIRNILALRGDPPRGQEYWIPGTGEFNYAIDLVKYIRKRYGDWFCIGVAAYPEGHVDGSSPERQDPLHDLPYLREKVHAGADFILTQIFYDIPRFLSFEKLLRDDESGIFKSIPIVPAVMPIQSYQSFRRMTKLTNASIPADLLSRIEAVKADDEAVKHLGVDVAVEMIKQIRAGTQQRCMGVHFCTFNLEKSVAFILERTEMISPREPSSPAGEKPKVEVVDVAGITSRLASTLGDDTRNRAIVDDKGQERLEPPRQKERRQSLRSTRSQQFALAVSEGQGELGREANWDEFPNGRWGDARSPAFGSNDTYGLTLRTPAEIGLRLWKHPESPQDISTLFTRYVRGALPAIPWSEDPLAAETVTIQKHLIGLNQSGRWTVGSQPAVNSVESGDDVFGWGPKGGYIFQKAFVEFFTSEEEWDKIRGKIKENRQVSFYAGNNNVCAIHHTNLREDL
jgi:methylenetetrahydrofolate reductase (NADPH)